MGSTGVNSTAARLPKYSNEYGVILEATVQADPRYQIVRDTLPEGLKYEASDIVRTFMRKEENAETTGTILVMDMDKDFKFGDRIKYTRAAIKAAGYKVTKSENADSHRRGYMGARGRRVYASTFKRRYLHFEKV